MSAPNIPSDQKQSRKDKRVRQACYVSQMRSSFCHAKIVSHHWRKTTNLSCRAKVLFPRCCMLSSTYSCVEIFSQWHKIGQKLSWDKRFMFSQLCPIDTYSHENVTITERGTLDECWTPIGCGQCRNYLLTTEKITSRPQSVLDGLWLTLLGRHYKLLSGCVLFSGEIKEVQDNFGTQTRFANLFSVVVLVPSNEEMFHCFEVEPERKTLEVGQTGQTTSSKKRGPWMWI